MAKFSQNRFPWVTILSLVSGFLAGAILLLNTRVSTATTAVSNEYTSKSRLFGRSSIFDDKGCPTASTSFSSSGRTENDQTNQKCSCSSTGSDDARPSKEIYDKIQADPDILLKHPEYVEEFKMAPWLLPNRTEAPILPYAGLYNDLDALLKLRALPVGKRIGLKVDRAITLMFFSRGYHLLFFNMYYTGLKYAELDNHIVVTFNNDDLETCRDLNFPCYDGTPHLPMPLEIDEKTGQPYNNPEEGYAGNNRHILLWGKLMLASAMLKKGIAAHITDGDIAYAPKPYWDSILRYIEVANINAKLDTVNGRVASAGLAEGAVNTGNLVFLPTPENVKLLGVMETKAVEFIKDNIDDQTGFNRHRGRDWRECTNWWNCKDISHETANSSMAIMRLYNSPWETFGKDVYSGGRGEFTPMIDICGSATVYAHPLMVVGGRNKRHVLINVQMWLIDDLNGCPKDNSTHAVERCFPLRWRFPVVEEVFNSCDREKLGLQMLPNTRIRSVFGNPRTGNAMFLNNLTMPGAGQK